MFSSITFKRMNIRSGLYLSRDLLALMLAHCRYVYPFEACGILAGHDDVVSVVYKMNNIEQSSVSYVMDSMEQFHVMKKIRNEGMQMIAIYHSHPQSPAYPSSEDIRLAFYDEVAYVIVSLIDYDNPDIRTFRICDGAVSELTMSMDGH